MAQEAAEEGGEEAEAEAEAPRASYSSRPRSAQPHPLSNIPPAHPNVVFSHHLDDVEDNSACAGGAALRAARLTGATGRARSSHPAQQAD